MQVAKIIMIMYLFVVLGCELHENRLFIAPKTMPAWHIVGVQLFSFPFFVVVGIMK